MQNKTLLLIGFVTLVLLLCLMTCAILTSAAADPFSPSLDDSILAGITGKEELRFFGGYKQGADSSCGIAATATLLRFFYGMPITEKYLIDKFFVAMEEKKNYTVSLLDIKSVCESYGFKTKGVKIDLHTLVKFDAYIPIVLHFLKPQAHFTLFLGTYGQYIFLDDPSVGICFMTVDEFITKFSGYALIVYGMEKLKNRDLIKQIRSTLTAKVNLLYTASQQRIGQ